MNPSFAAPVSLRRHALLEELRKLEQSRQAQHSASSQRLSIGELIFPLNRSALPGFMMDSPGMGLGAIDRPKALLRIDDARIQAAMRRSSGFEVGPSSPGRGMYLPLKNDFVNVAGGSKFGNLSSFGKLSTYQPKSLGMQKGNTALFSRSLMKKASKPMAGGGFPLPSLRKARKAKYAPMLSFKALWNNPNVCSPMTKREHFSRRLVKGKVDIVDQSRTLRLIDAALQEAKR